VVFSGPGKQPTLKERKKKKTLAKGATGYTTENIQRDTMSREAVSDYKRERTPPGRARILACRDEYRCCQALKVL
jgi:hypothetical protein